MVNKITIDEVEHDVDTMSDEQKNLVNIIHTNKTAANLLNHQLQCVTAIGSVKTEELRKLLASTVSDG
tara:strand:- start:71 stop:274 length:204 start_codon:yes stop_codon:yes gene_type:complete